MSRLPAFQFYPGDWLRNSNLRRCSPAARGAWMDIMCVLHDSDEYGVVRWPLRDLAAAAGIPYKLAKELSEKKVLKGADANAEPYIFRPKHAGVEGDPVTLVEPKDGPCWYSSRMVRDAYVRARRGASTRFQESPDGTPTGSPNTPPKPQPKAGFGDDFGDGPSSASAFANASTPLARGEDRPVERPAGMPTLDQALAFAKENAITADCAEKWFWNHEAENWTDKFHRVLPNWRASLRGYWKTWAENERRANATAQNKAAYGKHSTSRPSSPANNHSANAGAAGDY